MNKRRLLKLADLLDEDAENKKGVKFDLAPVLRKADGESYEGSELPTWDCGTTACALGLWALSGKFRDVSVVQITNKEFWPQYKSFVGRSAAEEYFEISEPQSRWLFLPSGYQGVTTGSRGERAVAKRIRDFVAGKATP